jgi:hypothetical protein
MKSFAFLSDDWYSEDDEGRGYNQQALSDRECYVYRLLPVEPQEGDGGH